MTAGLAGIIPAENLLVVFCNPNAFGCIHSIVLQNFLSKFIISLLELLQSVLENKRKKSIKHLVLGGPTGAAKAPDI